MPAFFSKPLDCTLLKTNCWYLKMEVWFKWFPFEKTGHFSGAILVFRRIFMDFSESLASKNHVPNLGSLTIHDPIHFPLWKLRPFMIMRLDNVEHLWRIISTTTSLVNFNDEVLSELIMNDTIQNNDNDISHQTGKTHNWVRKIPRGFSSSGQFVSNLKLSKKLRNFHSPGGPAGNKQPPTPARQTTQQQKAD